MPKKKILFFGVKYYPSRGGTSRVTENLIRRLVNHYEITLFCYKNCSAKTHIKGVRTIEIPEIKLGNLGVFIYYFLCYLHIKLKSDYDIIHAHKIDSFIFLNGLSKRAKVVATAHEAPYKRDKWGRIAKFFFKISERRFLKFDGVKTSISKPLCDFYKTKYNVNVQFIANGINTFEGEDEKQAMSFWPKNVSYDSTFVLFAARRIMGTKGLHTMLEAYKKINYKGNIFVAGELDNFPTYIKSVKEIAKGLNVYFLSFVNPLPVLLTFVKKCSYFVFPSETEGMSIMLLEVASTGTPIIASDIPENAQVFNDSHVLFFKNKDADDLSKKIKWAENNTTELKTMALKAQLEVNQKYTWDQITNQYIALYENLLKKE